MKTIFTLFVFLVLVALGLEGIGLAIMLLNAPSDLSVFAGSVVMILSFGLPTLAWTYFLKRFWSTKQ